MASLTRVQRRLPSCDECRRRGSCEGGAPAAQRGRTTLTATSGDTGCDRAGEVDHGEFAVVDRTGLLSKVWAVHERRRPALILVLGRRLSAGDMLADRVVPARFATAQSVRGRRREAGRTWAERERVADHRKLRARLVQVGIRSLPPRPGRRGWRGCGGCGGRACERRRERHAQILGVGGLVRNSRGRPRCHGLRDRRTSKSAQRSAGGPWRDRCPGDRLESKDHTVTSRPVWRTAWSDEENYRVSPISDQMMGAGKVPTPKRLTRARQPGWRGVNPRSSSRKGLILPSRSSMTASAVSTS